MKIPSIPKMAPDTMRETYGRVLELSDAISAIRVAACSETHPLELPEAAVAKLVEAHQAMMAAHRAIEEALTTAPGRLLPGEHK